jgi:hypothetical protein
MFSGCQTTSQVQNTWVGHHIDSLIARLGAPNAVIQLQSGGATYTWQEIKHYSKVYICNNNYTTNSSGIIVNTSWTGDPLMCS